MGDTGGLQTILPSEVRPQRAYLVYKPQHQAMTSGFYRWEHTLPMWHMKLRPKAFRSTPGRCVRLLPADASLLVDLYALGGGMAFRPAQIARGVSCGLFVGEHLVAAADTHLVSETYGVAAVGNVFTHPGHRGHGCGTATSAAVAEELLARDINDVVLNVSQANVSDVRNCERLGFERYCPFLEDLMHLRLS
jgi:GNAT superfamily N-acetyltransferase